MRDFKVDPIDQQNVAELSKSIKEDGFWGGVVARKRGSEYEIACGQHRVIAALKSGIDKADIFVLNHGNDDDAAMVRVYARENATQRGNTATASVGSVAAVIRLLAKAILMGHVGKFFPTSRKSLETLRGLLERGHGISDDVIARFLEGTPNCSVGTIREQLASLKASGDYARIIEEVRQEIEGETKDEKILTSARQASDVASGKAKTFDLSGVAKHLKNNDQVRVFRELVTGQGIAPHLEVGNQERLAKALVAKAKDEDTEISGRFIRENVVSMVLDAKRTARKLSRDEKEELERKDWVLQVRTLLDEFRRHIGGLNKLGLQLMEKAKDRPKDVDFPITPEFRNSLRIAKKIINDLNERI